MFTWWGPELLQFYNDAYSMTMGPERHPSALVQRGRECWQEIWPVTGPQIESILAGGPPTWHEDQLVGVTAGSMSLSSPTRPTCALSVSAKSRAAP